MFSENVRILKYPFCYSILVGGVGRNYGGARSIRLNNIGYIDDCAFYHTIS